VVDCIESSLAHEDKALRITPAQQVRDAFFPWLEESVLSLDPKQTAMLLSKPLFQEKARETGLRYLTFLTAGTGSAALHGPFFCGGAGAGAGCLGLGRIARETTFGAVIWDLAGGRESQRLEADEVAHDVMVGFVLPLWIPGGTSTRTRACHTMARNLIQTVRASDRGMADPSGEVQTVWRSPAEPTEDATAPAPPQ
jgi:hypothetical protein